MIPTNKTCKFSWITIKHKKITVRAFVLFHNVGEESFQGKRLKVNKLPKSSIRFHE